MLPPVQVKRAFDLVHKPALRLGMLKKAALQVRVCRARLGDVMTTTALPRHGFLFSKKRCPAHCMAERVSRDGGSVSRFDCLRQVKVEVDGQTKKTAEAHGSSREVWPSRVCVPP